MSIQISLHINDNIYIVINVHCSKMIPFVIICFVKTALFYHHIYGSKKIKFVIWFMEKYVEATLRFLRKKLVTKACNY